MVVSVPYPRVPAELGGEWAGSSLEYAGQGRNRRDFYKVKGKARLLKVTL